MLAGPRRWKASRTTEMRTVGAMWRAAKALKRMKDAVPEAEQEKMNNLERMTKEGRQAEIKPEDMPDKAKFEEAQQQMQDAIPVFVQAAWLYSKQDAVSTMARAVRRVVNDSSVPKPERQSRARAIARLSAVFGDAASRDVVANAEAEDPLKAVERARLSPPSPPFFPRPRPRGLLFSFGPQAIYSMMADAQGFSKDERSEFVPNGELFGFNQPPPFDAADGAATRGAADTAEPAEQRSELLEDWTVRP